MDNGIGSFRGAWGQARHKVWMLLGRSEIGLQVIAAYGKRRGGGLVVVSRTSRLVVEGYPRCANTFVVAALKVANGRGLEVAHHVHGPAQVLRAARFGVPCLVLIREPLGAVCSLMQRYPYLSGRVALGNYLRFYEALVDKRDSFVLADFIEVINDLPSVVNKLNRRFGIALRAPQSSEEQQATIRLVEQMDLLDSGRTTIDEGRVARPSIAREEVGKRLRTTLLRDYRNLVARCQDMHDRLVGGAERGSLVAR